MLSRSRSLFRGIAHGVFFSAFNLLRLAQIKKACAAAFERQPADCFQNAEPQNRKKQRIALRGGLEKEYPEIEKGPNSYAGTLPISLNTMSTISRSNPY